MSKSCQTLTDVCSFRVMGFYCWWNRALLLDGLTFPCRPLHVVDFVHASSGPCARPYPPSAR
ncbi:hypothetical protein K435DRAFT_784474 [Dendrothele bispora CBS 962.96]|uniref:Uncharacterized protein n=1 Tax=Dendrothele bispora (strain CBS 962.96) TaxID=1314807 RepID=A0A4S8L476_DENBC|nr:hypothetical protein K435DRAFT_784474 [Dendrothele bispora CBS 962.96]